MVLEKAKILGFFRGYPGICRDSIEIHGDSRRFCGTDFIRALDNLLRARKNSYELEKGHTSSIICYELEKTHTISIICYELNNLLRARKKSYELSIIYEQLIRAR